MGGKGLVVVSHNWWDTWNESAWRTFDEIVVDKRKPFFTFMKNASRYLLYITLHSPSCHVLSCALPKISRTIYLPHVFANAVDNIDTSGRFISIDIYKLPFDLFVLRIFFFLRNKLCLFCSSLFVLRKRWAKWLQQSAVNIRSILRWLRIKHRKWYEINIMPYGWNNKLTAVDVDSRRQSPNLDCKISGRVDDSRVVAAMPLSQQSFGHAERSNCCFMRVWKTVLMLMYLADGERRTCSVYLPWLTAVSVCHHRTHVMCTPRPFIPVLTCVCGRHTSEIQATDVRVSSQP